MDAPHQHQGPQALATITSDHLAFMQPLGCDEPAAAPAYSEAPAAHLAPSIHPKTRASSASPTLPRSAAYAPAARPDCRGHIRIGYQITEGQLRGEVEIAYETDTTQLLVTVLWAGRIDDLSRRVLADALRAAAKGQPVRIHAFAAAARELFRHTSQTLAPRAGGRGRRRRARHPARDGPLDALSSEASAGLESLHDELLAAIDELSRDSRLQPRVVVTNGAEAERFVTEALSALQGLFASLGSFLERVLQPLEPHISRHAVRAFVLETCLELDELAACRTVGEAYAEALTVTELGDKAESLVVEVSLDVMKPAASKVARKPHWF